MINAANEYLHSAVTARSRRSYESALNSYTNYIEFDRVPHSERWPPSASRVSLWIAYMAAERKLGVSTIRAYVSCLNMWFREQGLLADHVSWRADPLIHRLIEGVLHRHDQLPRLERRPLTTTILRLVEQAGFSCPTLSPFHQLLTRALMWIATVGIFRLGELVATQGHQGAIMSQLTCLGSAGEKVHHAQALSFVILLPRDKTNKGRGTEKVLSGSELVSAFRAYLDARSAIAAGSAPSAIFVTDAGKPLSRSRFMPMVRAVLAHARIPNPELYYGHSFRSGGAQTLVDLNAPERDVVAHGGWARGSKMPQLYAGVRRDHRIMLARRM
jgi:hypothetical protein